MAQSLSKYFAVWFGVALVVGMALFLLNGDGNSLNPAIENALLKNCQEQSGGFANDQVQQCLDQVGDTLLERAIGVRANLMYWFTLNALAVLIIGLLFMVLVNQRNGTAGSPQDFRSMRGSWFAHLLGIAVLSVTFAGLAHVTSLFAAWGADLTQARGWGIPAFLIIVWCASFWLGNANCHTGQNATIDPWKLTVRRFLNHSQNGTRS